MSSAPPSNDLEGRLMAEVRFEEATKVYAGTDVAAVDALDLHVEDGEFMVLVGPSGSGKTTALRMLAGLEEVDAGAIFIGDADVTDVQPKHRDVAMVFQNYALYPYLTVEANIGFPLKIARMKKEARERRVREVAELLELTPYLARKPGQLSGGQRQRVALARSLVKRPKVLLLDEPLAALDRKLREETQFELMELQAKLGTTFVIVTHDQEEAMTVADRIAVMEHGRIAQVATPPEIYEQPISRYVAGFVGDVNVIEGRLVATGPAGSLIESAAGARIASAQAVECELGATVWLALRPEKIRIAIAEPEAGENRVAGQIEDIGYLGNLSVYKVRLDNGFVMKAAFANATRLIERPIGWNERVWLSWSPDAALVLTR